MLIIRKEQVDVFKQISINRFEKKLILHVQTVAPEIAKVSGESNIRLFVREGIQQAFSYGFSYQGTVRFYIDMLLLLGYGFSDDPQFPWVSKILNSSDDRGQIFRANQLFVSLKNYLHIIYGKNNIHLIEAIQKFNTFSSLNNEYDINSSQEFLDIFMSIYPQKAKHLGNNHLLELMDNAKKVSLLLSMTNKSSFVIITILMFSFGHKVFEDPLYPWVYKLANNVELEETERIYILQNKLKIYLDHVLINLKG